ncbi:MAG: prolipoprotein diacylglyceryl transferase [Eubacterium sp.]|nr:prolipoprotein diacylglyceryl transferase [Eubacterium sp.]
MNGIYFPGLGIYFKNVLSGFNVFGVSIKFYGLIIALGFIGAYLISAKEGKRTGQDPELYLDLLLTLVVPSILGARIYYIIFNTKDFIKEGMSFGQILLGMINVRNGGLAIYGGLIAGAITIYFFGRHKKVSWLLILDTITMGILFGQIIGRWGNFFNREVFGGYTNSIFRMAIPVEYYSTSFMDYLTKSGIVTQEMLSNTEVVNGVSCITVHPTFIYESLWNVLVLIIILLLRKHKKCNGEIFAFYMFLYGIGRLIIEGIRTDSLMAGSFRISQVVAVLCIVTSVVFIAASRKKLANSPQIEEKVEQIEEKTEEKAENEEKIEKEDEIEEDTTSSPEE